MADRELRTDPSDVINDHADRIKQLEIATQSRVLPPQFVWKLSGTGELIVRNVKTGTETTLTP